MAEQERYFTACGLAKDASPETLTALARVVELVYAAVDRGEFGPQLARQTATRAENEARLERIRRRLAVEREMRFLRAARLTPRARVVEFYATKGRARR